MEGREGRDIVNDNEAFDGLRRANPVPDPRSAFTPDLPAAQALFEEITMTAPRTHTVPAPGSAPPLPPAPRALGRRWRAVALAGVASAAAVAAALTFTGDPNRRPADQAAVPDPAAGISPVSPGGAMCVELYHPDTLRNRQHAFDGTVAAVAGDSVTFDVTEWFKAAERPASITLQGASTLSAITPNGPATTLDPGTRLLVAGDGEFAWGCGFTQPYSEATAAAWRNALR